MFISVDVCFWVLKCLQICRCRASGDKRSHRKVTFTVSSFDTLPFLVAISLSHLDTLLWIIGWVIYGSENGNCWTIWRTKELTEPPESDISLFFFQQAWIVIIYTHLHQLTPTYTNPLASSEAGNLSRNNLDWVLFVDPIKLWKQYVAFSVWPWKSLACTHHNAMSNVF